MHRNKSRGGILSGGHIEPECLLDDPDDCDDSEGDEDTEYVRDTIPTTEMSGAEEESELEIDLSSTSLADDGADEDESPPKPARAKAEPLGQRRARVKPIHDRGNVERVPKREMNARSIKVLSAIVDHWPPRAADLNRAIGEAPDWRGIYTIIRFLRARKFIHVTSSDVRTMKILSVEGIAAALGRAVDDVRARVEIQTAAE